VRRLPRWVARLDYPSLAGSLGQGISPAWTAGETSCPSLAGSLAIGQPPAWAGENVKEEKENAGGIVFKSFLHTP